MAELTMLTAVLTAVLTALLSGAVVGAALLWWAVRGRIEQAAAAARAASETQRALLVEKLRVADVEQRELHAASDDLRKALSSQRQELAEEKLRALAGADKRIEAIELQRHELSGRLDTAQAAITELRERNGGLVAELKAEREQAGEKLAVLSEARSALVGQF